MGNGTGEIAALELQDLGRVERTELWGNVPREGMVSKGEGAEVGEVGEGRREGAGENVEPIWLSALGGDGEVKRNDPGGDGITGDAEPG